MASVDSAILARNAKYTMECHSTVDELGYCVGCRTYHGKLDQPGLEGCYFYRLANEVHRKHTIPRNQPTPIDERGQVKGEKKDKAGERLAQGQQVRPRGSVRGTADHDGPDRGDPGLEVPGDYDSESPRLRGGVLALVNTVKNPSA